ncbi:type IV toxin-antitoxin system AbiEi family antitoxin domain-containing protein [Arthrobacter sp. KK5.5]|uniref:type IV toxin-antitoxin system AbiEi family antitoxin domain-containing protein n=1 Tax=Arthrobacter sp. KK5.5 TaxID=3373084 RepID=UPI003EE7DC50
MEAEMALAEAGGLARWKALTAAGVGARELGRAVRSGTVVRPGHGIYALSDCAPELAQALRVGASLGCVSAAGAHGLWVLRKHGLHLSSPRGVVVPARGRVHRVRARHGPVVPVEVCLRQVVACLPPREALVVVESAVVKGLVQLDELESIFAGRGSKRSREVLVRIDCGSESIAETLARDALRSAGHDVVCQRRSRAWEGWIWRWTGPCWWRSTAAPTTRTSSRSPRTGAAGTN